MSLFKRNAVNQNILFYDSAAQSGFADQIRLLRTYLHQNHPDVQVLQLTSARANEGKSIVAANLALANAKIGKKTLLVDTNFDYPNVQLAFQPGQPHNLIDAINASTITQPSPTTFSKLDVITAQKTNASISDTLASPRLQQLVDHWRQTYDLIIFDSSDLTANPNAKIIATLSDATLLSVNIGKTTKESLAQAQTALADIHAATLGYVAVKK